MVILNPIELSIIVVNIIDGQFYLLPVTVRITSLLTKNNSNIYLAIYF